MTARLAAIQERVEKATEGPWIYYRPVVNGTIRRPDGRYILEAHHMGGVRHDEDGEFIAQAREDIPYLLQQIADLEAALTHQQEQIDSFCMDYRLKCDEQTKQQAIRLEAAEAALSEARQQQDASERLKALTCNDCDGSGEDVDEDGRGPCHRCMGTGWKIRYTVEQYLKVAAVSRPPREDQEP